MRRMLMMDQYRNPYFNPTYGKKLEKDKNNKIQSIEKARTDKSMFLKVSICFFLF